MEQEVAQGAPEAPAEGGQELSQALATIGQAMMSLREGAAGSMPKEAVAALDASIDAFKQFIEIAGGGAAAAPAEEAPRSMAGRDAMAGSSSARPVEM